MELSIHGSLRNRRETSTSEKLAAVALAAVGTLVLMIVMLVGLQAPDEARAALAPADEVALAAPACRSNVALATSGRIALCLSPWRGDSVEQCLEDAKLMMWMDLSACDAISAPAAPVAMAMVPPRALEKLTPIDPERLLEEMTPPDQPVPPPPQPQPQVAPQPPPPPPPPAARRRPQQVVETVKPSHEEAPDDARFLSEHDVKVDKQTVARGARDEPMVAKSKPEELTPTKKPVEQPSVQKKPPDKPPGRNPKAPEVPGTLAMRRPGAPNPAHAPQQETTRGQIDGGKGPVVSDGFIPRRGDGAIEQTRRELGELTPGEGGAGGGTPEVPNLRPTKEQLERIVGGGSVDHLEDVEEGDETALSSKRWVYASFFNRMKRQVAQNWDPQSVWRRTDPDGTKHGFKTRVTEVRVTLSGRGVVEKIVVTSPSGVAELDDEAVRSFQAASPFPNPPGGLVKNGRITFAFSFYFEIGHSRTAWRVIRQ